MIDPAALQAEADSFAWYHSIDLGDGVVSKGQSVMAEMVTEAQLPDFRGKTVLDIGAWDGYYSFLAERRARRAWLRSTTTHGVSTSARARSTGTNASHAVSFRTSRATSPTSGVPIFRAGAASISRTRRTRGRLARRLHLVPSARPNPAAANFRAVVRAFT